MEVIVSYVNTTEQRVASIVRYGTFGNFGLPCPACDIQVSARALIGHLTGDRHKYTPTMAMVLHARAVNLYDIAVREAAEALAKR